MGSSLKSVAKVALTAAAVVAASAIGLGPIATALLVGGAAVSGAFIANEVFPSSDNVTDSASIKANFRTTQKVIPVIYGERIIGSNDVFMTFSGESGDTPFLWIVHALGEGAVEGISQVEGVDQVFINSKLASEYDEGLVEYWFYQGTDTQSYNTELNSAYPDWNDNLRYTSYIVFKIKFDTKVFATIPKREVVVKGLKVYDFRSPSSPYSWSSNPVLVLYDYITNTRYGLGWDPTIIDIPTWTVAANYCDLQVGTPSRDKWSINYVISSMMKSQSVIDLILGHFRGSLSWFDGRLVMYYYDLYYEVPVFDIADEHIMRDSDGRASVSAAQPSRHSSPSGVLVKYINKKDSWGADDINIGEKTGQVKPISFAGYTDKDQALSMGTYTLERDRLTRSYSLALRPDAIKLEIGDLVTVTSSELELTAQVARVIESDINMDGSIALTLLAEDITLYDDEYQPDSSTSYELDFDFSNPPGPVRNVVITEETYVYRERTFVKLLIVFDPPTTGEGVYAVTEISVSTDGTEYVYYTRAESNFFIDNADEGVTYYIKFKTISARGVVQEDADAVIATRFVIGAGATPPPLTSDLEASIGLYSVCFRAASLEEKDVAGYELRIGNELWGRSLLAGRSRYPFFNFPIFRPGSHVARASAIGTNGIYGQASFVNYFNIDSPVAFQDESFDLPVDFTSGIYENTEAVDLGGGQYAIRCKREGGSLVGRYTSDAVDTLKTDVNKYWLIYFDYLYDIPGHNPGNTAEAYKLKLSLTTSASEFGPFVENPGMEFYVTNTSNRYYRVIINIEDYDAVTFLRVKSLNVIGGFRSTRKYLSGGPLYIR